MSATSAERPPGDAAEPAASKPGAPMLRTENLAKTFIIWEKGLVRKQVRAVESVSFSVQPNEIFGFVGPNGAGKTTTIKMLMGLIFPSSGTVELLGAPVPNIDAKRRIGFLPENPYFYDYLTGRELLNAQQLRNDVTHKITTRYFGRVNPALARWVLGTRTFNIVSAVDVTDRHRMTVHICTEVVSSAS